jgi:hypothetical protein
VSHLLHEKESSCTSGRTLLVRVTVPRSVTSLSEAGHTVPEAALSSRYDGGFPLVSSPPGHERTDGVGFDVSEGDARVRVVRHPYCHCRTNTPPSPLSVMPGAPVV